MILDDGHGRQGHFAIAAWACPYQEESDRYLSGSGPRTALCRPRGTSLRAPSRRYTHPASWRLQHPAQAVRVDHRHVEVEGIQDAVGQRVIITKPAPQPIAPMQTPKPRMLPAGFHTSPPRQHRCRPPRRMARWYACRYEWQFSASPPDGRPTASPTDTLASGRAPRRPGTYTGHRSVCDSLWTPKTHESLYRSYRLRRSTESRPQKLAAAPLASVAQSRFPPILTTGLGRF
jgi:hypothetical protein